MVGLKIVILKIAGLIIFNYYQRLNQRTLREPIGLAESNLIISESLWLMLSIKFISAMVVIDGRLIILAHWNLSHSPKHLLVENGQYQYIWTVGGAVEPKSSQCLTQIWQYKLDLANFRY